jgi:hypothetical protein
VTAEQSGSQDESSSLDSSDTSISPESIQALQTDDDTSPVKEASQDTTQSADNEDQQQSAA